MGEKKHNHGILEIQQVKSFKKEELINSFKCCREIKVKREIYPLNLEMKTIVTLLRGISMVMKRDYSRRKKLMN